ncbi:hypothetical protein [Defluviicoccus vanus]|uniref:DUF4402 domain-containing protein n=1 Tax=Defluviicoccus vanus TaxID=111831 RepID=A0A7H1MZ11_9PROT|nr:hypothetical protein [Defluviicoccus vanus]QNT68697.1 hypothetical protein HQ394_04105 [Defluviicoccus vanus]
MFDGSFAGLGIVALSLTLGVSAAAGAATPTMFLESAAISGAATTIRVNRVPVRTQAGTIIYKDISLPFIVDGKGNVTLDQVGLSIVASPTLITSAFKPGTYNGISDSNYVVGSPGSAGGGRVSGSILGTSSYYGFSANWVSGPIAGHPYQAALIKAGITSATQAYGVVGYVYSTSFLPGWHAGDIVGAVQTSNTLLLTNYGTDNIPDTALTFTLCPTSAAC